MKITITIKSKEWAKEWVVLVDAVISEEKRAREFAMKLNSNFYAERAEHLAEIYELLLSDCVTFEEDGKGVC